MGGQRHERSATLARRAREPHRLGAHEAGAVAQVLVREGRVRSAHDCAEGGLAVLPDRTRRGARWWLLATLVAVCKPSACFN